MGEAVVGRLVGTGAGGLSGQSAVREDVPVIVSPVGLVDVLPLCRTRYTVKKRFAIFPSPAGMSLTKLSLDGNNLIIPA